MNPKIIATDIVSGHSVEREMTDEEYETWKQQQLNAGPLNVVGDNADVQHPA